MSIHDFNDRFGVSEPTPTEFEKAVMKLFMSLPDELVSKSIEHNVKIPGIDGIYQIDIKLTFEVFGANFLVLIECKRYSSPVKREAVQILHSKLSSLGAQKGVLVSTSGFQRGAIQYAKEHGIALLRIAAGRMTYETKNIFSDGEYQYFNGTEAFPIYRIEESSPGSISITMLIDDHINEFGVSLFKSSENENN
ncbi:MAG: restriction endonuclease [Bacteroidales bacterium]|nr:restriction endonuclease [Bacteroidales bacterium]